MLRDFYFDKLLFISFILLMGIGLIFVSSATSVPSFLNNKDPYFFVKKEILWIFIAFIFMVISYLVPIEYWKKAAYPMTVLAIFLLIIVLIFYIQLEHKDVRRWLGFGAFRFQPSEFAKIAVVFFLAYFSYRKRQILKTVEATFAAFLIPFIISFLVFVEPHKGAAIFIIVLTILIMFSAEFDWKKVLFLPALSLPFLFFMILLSKDYAINRITAFLNPLENKSDTGYQIFQAMLAFAKGGLLVEGIGAGTQKLKYLPEIHTDYIFALIGEEIGLIGATVLIFIFLFILYRGIKISINADDTFTQVLGVGLTYLIVLQGLFHMAVNVSLFPPTGFTLPFVSYGGSSLVMMAICAGILLRISKEPRKSIFSQ